MRPLTSYFRLLSVLVIFTLAVLTSLLSDAQMRPRPPGGRPPQQQRHQRPQQGSSDQTWTHKIPADAGSAEAPLLIAIGIHIEPFGAKHAAQRNPARPLDYKIPQFFNNHLKDLKSLVAIVERHGGKVTVQAQSPFTEVLIQNGNPLFRDLQAKGHEIALHFHEDAHLGKDPENLSTEPWTKFMTEEIGLLKKAGACQVRYWSGGNLYPNVLQAATAAGLDIFGDHKNPKTQGTFAELQIVHPWRPAGGPTENDIAAFAKHDPNGRIVYLPGGKFPSMAIGTKRGPNQDGLAFENFTVALDQSLRAARKDRVNVFHITIHPGEYKGGPGGNFGIVERWLTQVVDPLVKAGKVKWAIFSEMAGAYEAWEKNNPGVDPRSPQAASAPSSARKKGYMTFAMNVHDTVYWEESAKTLLRLVEIYKKHGVRGDFYLTGPIADIYRQKRPDVIAALKSSGMTISYHVRPPHPLYLSFDAALKNLSDAALKQTLTDYETYALDLATGGLDRSRPGGYALVKALFGSAPVTIGAPNSDRRIKRTALQVYKEMGAKAVVWYHETGTQIDKPYEWHEGLLARPSDFSITRWPFPGQPSQGNKDPFWWNLVPSPRHGADFNPTARLKAQLAAWSAARPPFVTSLIHENNFYRKGPEAWKAYYFRDGNKNEPLSPPYNLAAKPAGSPRSQAEQDAIWRAYEELVAYAAQNMTVVTSADIVQMAEAGTY